MLETPIRYEKSNSIDEPIRRVQVLMLERFFIGELVRLYPHRFL